MCVCFAWVFMRRDNLLACGGTIGRVSQTDIEYNFQSEQTYVVTLLHLRIGKLNEFFFEI